MPCSWVSGGVETVPVRRYGCYGSRNTIVAMSPKDPLRLIVDFNYSGEKDGVVGVFLGSKQGDRAKLSNHVQKQFDAASTSPEEGMKVLLVDPRSDLDDQGVECDMEVVGTLHWVEDGWGWRALYQPEELRWVPSAS
jgi:hypothetical protein